MCTHDHTPRRGTTLEQADAHSEDHLRFSRREFLGLTSMWTSLGLLMGNTPVLASHMHPMLSYLQGLETERVLVLIQLNGGNDGLNTVIPLQNDVYYQKRPKLAISSGKSFMLNKEYGLNTGLKSLEPFWKEGKMGILRNVGYPDPNMSHFRSTDIWVTGSDSDEYENSGWIGRFMDAQFPETGATLRTYPVAVQIGTNQSLIFQNKTSPMSMNLSDPGMFERLSREGKAYAVNGAPSNAFSHEQAWIRKLANQSYTYAGAVHQASKNSSNEVAYPPRSQSGDLGVNLSIVARLIKGGLKSRIYLVSLNGFDTHVNQFNQHEALLKNLGDSVTAFYADLAKQGLSNKVLTMTFSEFGRTLRENGSEGTDHATGAPLFLFGDEVNGGFYGKAPDLVNLDERGEIKFDLDYRHIYSTVLKDWFGISEQRTNAIQKKPFSTMDLIRTPITTRVNDQDDTPQTFVLRQNYPNPFNPTTRISYTLMETQPVRLFVVDLNGRVVRQLTDAIQSAGNYELTFDGRGLASGVYMLVLQTPNQRQSIKMSLVK